MVQGVVWSDIVLSGGCNRMYCIILHCCIVLSVLTSDIMYWVGNMMILYCTHGVVCFSVLDLNAFERQNKAEGLGMVSEEGTSECSYTHQT